MFVYLLVKDRWLYFIVSKFLWVDTITAMACRQASFKPKKPDIGQFNVSLIQDLFKTDFKIMGQECCDLSTSLQKRVNLFLLAKWVAGWLK